MIQETFYIDIGTSRLWFNVIDGVVCNHATPTPVPYDKFITFIQTARELGLKTGKL